MPSAATVNLDKQQIPPDTTTTTTTTSLPDPSANSIPQNSSPIRQAIVILEHKIRNLEKRKAKLESYRALKNTGKDLNHDQKIAVAKYDEVVQTLDFARDLCKQFVAIASGSEKDAKKQARKEATQKNQQELAKVREVLLVQDALTQMGQDNVREDFLLGRNGAVTLTENDLKLLDDFYPDVTPKHEVGNPEAFTNHVQSAAEHLLAAVEGKPKEVAGSSYTYLKEVIGKIHESGYFDQPLPYEEPQQLLALEELQEVVAPLPEEPQPQPPQQQQQAQPYYQPQQRPISEVLGTNTFFFLQDSELDTPPEQPQLMAPVPTQTFTNQSYQQQQQQQAAPPPPIPLPPSCLLFQQFSQEQQQQQEGFRNGEEMGNEKEGGRQRPAVQTTGGTGGSGFQQQQQPFYQNNNGYSNRARHQGQQQQQPQGQGKGQRPGGRQMHQQHQQQQKGRP